MICVSIDLDGTLLNSKHELSEENLLALKELQENGYEVILNTGRAYADIIKNPAIKNLELPIICLNGSAVFSKEGELLYETGLSFNTYHEIITTLKRMGVWTLIYTNYGGYPSTLPPLHVKSNEELGQLFSEFDYDEILSRDNLKVYKLIGLVKKEVPGKIEEIKKELAPISGISMASSFPNNVEIYSNQAQKGKALLRYQKMLHLSFEEIFAFGDGENDLAQFEVATTSVAMGNAPLHIQRAASIVTKTNDEDGFSYGVRELLQLLKYSKSVS